jgi:hypothetical protein
MLKGLLGRKWFLLGEVTLKTPSKTPSPKKQSKIVFTGFFYLNFEVENLNSANRFSTLFELINLAFWLHFPNVHIERGKITVGEMLFQTPKSTPLYLDESSSVNTC